MDQSVAADGDDWGYQPGKGGMAIEAKLGLFIILILVSAFGFLVWRNVDRHQQMLIGGDPTSEESELNVPDEQLGLPEDSLSELTAESEPDFGELTFHDESLSEPDPADSTDSVPDFGPDPASASEGDEGLIATWDEVPRQSADEDSTPFESFDVADSSQPSAASTDSRTAADIDPFAGDDFSEQGLGMAATDDEPLTDWADAGETGLATDDGQATEGFAADADLQQDAAEVPEFSSSPEADDPLRAPRLAFGNEDVPDEYRQRPAPSEPVETVESVPAPQLPAVDDGWTDADSEDAFVADDSEADPQPPSFSEDSEFAFTEPETASVQEPGDESPLADSELPQLSQNDGTEPLDAFGDETTVIIQEEPELTAADLRDPVDEGPENFTEERGAFADREEFAVDMQPEPELNLNPPIDIVARDDDFSSDREFDEAFDTPRIEPRESFDVVDVNDEPVGTGFGPDQQGVDQFDQDLVQRDEFPLQDADDSAAADLRPVNPAGGQEPILAPLPTSAAPFDAREFAYENTVVTASAEEESYDICEVRPGDNYWKISRRMYGTSRYFSALALYNHHRVRDPKKLRPGMKILIPDPGVLEQKYPQLFRDSKPKERAPSGYFVQRDGTPAYRIGERDTLSEIAQKHLGRSSRWIQIYRLNRNVLSNPNRLKPGTVIILPDSATNVQMVP